MPPLLHLQDITLTLGGAPLLEGAELSVGAGERICLVGRNGSGKSTLLRIAAGSLAQDAGTRFVQPGTRLRYLEQEPDLSAYASTRDYVEAGLDDPDDAYRARALLEEMGLSGDETPARLSGGEARRAALARALAPSPELLLLDEPTNHLDLPAIEWLERELASLRAGIVLISHDRRMLETLSRAVIWLDGGTTRRMERGFAHFETWREEVAEAAATEAQKLGRQIAREEDWMRYGVTARRKRNVRRVGELAALRQKRADQMRPGAGLKLEAQPVATSGRLVVDAEHVRKSYGNRVIIGDLTLRVLRGDRLGIIGPNGAGKTTLLRLLTGADQPDGGRVALGTNLELVTLEQTRASLDPGKTLADTLTAGGGDQVSVGGERRHVIGYMKDFLFRPEQARTPVGVLSGGERARLLLATALARRANLLVLDEPTNDLDLETLDLLQDLLAEYPGTVLLVSHDRDFLDRTVTATLAAEGDGAWIEYAGGYSDMLAQRRGGSHTRHGGGDPVARPPPPDRRALAQTSPAAPRPSGKRLSFRDRHALDALPARIDALAAEIARQQALLADPQLYRQSPARFTAAREALRSAEREHSDAEERWLELELLASSEEG